MRTVVLVHGAWHGAWCWASLQAELDRRGVPSVALDLPGHGASTDPLGDLHGDAAHVSAVLDVLARDVVLVGHSYGGAVIGRAATGRTDVDHLVYLAAFCLEEASTLLAEAERSPVGNELVGGLVIEGAVATVAPDVAVKAFYADCSPEATAAALARLGPQPLATFGQPVGAAAWRDLPSTYVACTLDQAIAVEHQRLMAQRCGRLVELEASHSPFLSMPGAVADLLAPLAST